MAGSADGYIRIDTRINQAGAQAGLGQLSKSLKGFAAAVGIAFGIAAVVRFGKECIDVASDLAEIQNVIDVTFGSAAGRVNEFAKSAATSYGLSELAAKQYSGVMGAMLKSMGFTTDAATGMALSMAGLAGDMASFYNLDSKEAFEKIRSGISGETEPLKQLGVNLSEANLSAYALAQGITTAYSKMSEQNKALIRYNYLLDKTKDAQGDFARTSNSWANQVRVLQLQWSSFKGVLGTAFIAVLTPVLQIINKVLGALNSAAVVFANFIAAVTGTQQAVTTGATAAADAVGGLADSTEESGAAAKKAGKDAKKGLQSFDELNVMAKDAADAAGGAAGGVGAATVTTTKTDKTDPTSTSPMLEGMKAFFDKYQEQIQRVKDGWTELQGTVTGIIDGFKQQLDDTDIGGALFEGILNAAYAVETELNLLIGVVGKVLLAFNIPKTIETGLRAISAAFKAIGDVAKAVTPGVFAFVDKALVPIATWVGGKVRDAFVFLAEQLTKVGDWFTKHQADFTEIGKALGDITAAVWKLIEPLADAVWETAKAVIGKVVDLLLAFGDWCMDHKEVVSDIAIVLGSLATAITLVAAALNIAEIAMKAWAFICGLGELATGGFAAAIAVITSPIGIAIAAIAAVIAIVVLCIKHWDDIKAATKVTWDAIKNAVSVACTAIGNAAKVAWNAIKTTVTTVGNAIGSAASTSWNAIKSTITGVWNSMQGAASTTWNGIKGVWGSVSGWFTDKVITPLGAAFDGLKTRIKGVWDGIGDTIRGAVNIIISLVNGLIRGVNKFNIKIPDWVGNIPGMGDYGGKSIGFKIPEIPKLAQGAVIAPNRQFAAILGDQKSGVNIETPLDTMLQAFKAAIAESGTGGTPTVQITFAGELAALGKVLAPAVTVAQNAANRAAGRTLQTI